MTEWEKICSDRLLEILSDLALGQPQKATKWAVVREDLLAQARRRFDDTRFQRINLTDVSLQRHDLSGFDLARVYFARVQFDSATLKNASFRQAIFVDCSMAYADIQGADFWEANLNATSFHQVKNYHLGTNLNSASAITAERNLARPELAQLSLQHRLAADVDRSTTNEWMRGWNRLTKHGADFRPVAAMFFGVNFIFGMFYYSVQFLRPQAFAPQRDYDVWDTIVMALLRSVTTSAITEPAEVWLAYVFFLNALLGILIVGLFVAQITKLFMRVP